MSNNVKTKLCIDIETSERIISLRFLLSVLVVFFHNKITIDTIQITGGMNINQFLYLFPQLLVSDGIAKYAVPLFFVFSGDLLGSKLDCWSVLFRKKIHSLAIPYVAWIIIYTIYTIGAKLLLLKFAPSIVENPGKTVFTWELKDWISHIIGFSSAQGGNPFSAGQFWFVRDLFIFSILTPVIIKILQICPVLLFFAVTLFSLFGNFRFDDHLPSAIFYYICGLCCGIFKIRFFTIIDKCSWGELIFLFLFCFLGKYFFLEKLSVLLWFEILFSCLLVIKLSGVIRSNKILFSRLKYLSGFSFFIYAVHMPFLMTIVQKVWLRIFPINSFPSSILEYFGVSMLVVCLSLLMGIFLSKCCPLLFKWLNGGRI